MAFLCSQQKTHPQPEGHTHLSSEPPSPLSELQSHRPPTLAFVSADPPALRGFLCLSQGLNHHTSVGPLRKLHIILSQRLPRPRSNPRGHPADAPQPFPGSVCVSASVRPTHALVGYALQRAVASGPALCGPFVE